VSSQRLREASVVLGLLLMVMVGAIVVVWVSRPGTQVGAPGPTRPGATRSPTAAAGTPGAPATSTSSPTAAATATLTAPTSAPPTSPTSSPSESPAPTDSAAPSLSASPSPDETAGAPGQAITFHDVGLDTTGTADEELRPRHFTFVAQGPGRIEAEVSNVSFGRVRICLWPGEPPEPADADCRTTRGDRIRQRLDSGEPQAWTVSVIGSQAGASPSVDLRLAWPAPAAEVRLEGFRFQGEAIENYNGFVAELAPTADGELAVTAAFDDGAGGAYPWRLEVADGDDVFAQDGNGAGMSSRSSVVAGARYRVTLANRQTVAEQRVLLSATLSWP
jgi:hypothetical protein